MDGQDLSTLVEQGNFNQYIGDIDKFQFKSDKFERDRTSINPPLYYILKTLSELSAYDNWFFKIKGSPSQDESVDGSYLFAHVAHGHLLSPQWYPPNDHNHNWDSPGCQTWRISDALRHSFVFPLSVLLTNAFSQLVNILKSADNATFKKVARAISISNIRTVPTIEIDTTKLLHIFGPLGRMYLDDVKRVNSIADNDSLRAISIQIDKIRADSISQKTTKESTQTKKLKKEDESLKKLAKSFADNRERMFQMLLSLDSLSFGNLNFLALCPSLSEDYQGFLSTTLVDNTPF
jgi:hypothetical protein